MPRFFFDTNDGDEGWKDDAGRAMPDLEAARQAALTLLPDLAREKLPDGDQRAFSVEVRNEEGAIIYAASLTLRGGWKIKPPVDPMIPFS